MAAQVTNIYATPPLLSPDLGATSVLATSEHDSKEERATRIHHIHLSFAQTYNNKARRLDRSKPFRSSP